MTDLDNFEPESIVIKPRGKHTATVIWLHGLGDEAEGMQPFADLIRSEESMAHIKFILPTAPEMHVTANAGRLMNSWFDYYSFDVDHSEQDERGMNRAVGWIKTIIEDEKDESNIPPERIVVGGFSQGGAVALLLGITDKEHHLAGVFTLSSYVPLAREIKEIKSPHISSTPIFWGHGTADELYSDERALVATKALANDLGVRCRHIIVKVDDEIEDYGGKPEGVEFRAYEGLAHWIQPREVDHLTEWLAAVLPETTH